MSACGQGVGCGVCDTPELWHGTAGLCARVCACVGAAESLHTYIPGAGRCFVGVNLSSNRLERPGPNVEAYPSSRLSLLELGLTTPQACIAWDAGFATLEVALGSASPCPCVAFVRIC